MAATPIVVDAAPCKDAKGRSIRCPAAKPAPKKPCKDAKGKFIKCPRWGEAFPGAPGRAGSGQSITWAIQARWLAWAAGDRL